MKSSINQKLVVVSKITLHTLQILGIILIFMTVIPWLFPTAGIGRFLMSFYSIVHLIKPENTDYVFQHFSILSQFLGIIGSMLSLCPLFIGVIAMMKVTRNYLKGQVFTLFNAKAYQRLGGIYLLSALVLQPLAQVFFSLSISFIHEHIGQRFISFSIDVNNITTIFFACVLIIIGHVMQLAHTMEEEQALTI